MNPLSEEEQEAFLDSEDSRANAYLCDQDSKYIEPVNYTNWGDG